MAIENGELMHECFPKHLRMGTARLKQDNETEEESRKRRMNVERSTKYSGHEKKSCPVTLSCSVTSVTHDRPFRLHRIQSPDPPLLKPNQTQCHVRIMTIH